MANLLSMQFLAQYIGFGGDENFSPFNVPPLKQTVNLTGDSHVGRSQLLLLASGEVALEVGSDITLYPSWFVLFNTGKTQTIEVGGTGNMFLEIPPRMWIPFRAKEAVYVTPSVANVYLQFWAFEG